MDPDPPRDDSSLSPISTLSTSLLKGCSMVASAAAVFVSAFWLLDRVLRDDESFFSASEMSGDVDANESFHVSQLVVYPIKSCAGVEVEEWPIESTGFLHDRRYMVVRASDHVFLTQRQIPRLARIQPEFSSDHQELWVRYLDARVGDSLSVPMRVDRFPSDHLEQDLLESDESNRIYETRVWNDRVRVVDLGDELARWLTTVLDSEPVRLVRMLRSFVRPVNFSGLDFDLQKEKENKFPDITESASLVDSYPFLLASEASVQAVRDLTGNELIDSRRFRANILISGCDAFAEDDFEIIRIGGITFIGCAPCTRCKVTTVDPDTGHLPESLDGFSEPLRSLCTYRMLEKERKSAFGRKLIVDLSTSRSSASPLVVRRGDNVVVKRVSRIPLAHRFLPILPETTSAEDGL